MGLPAEMSNDEPNAANETHTHAPAGSNRTLGQEAFPVNRLIHGDALAELRKFPSNLAQAVVTSPPFWGQRLYEDETPVIWSKGTESVAFGRESTPEDYVRHAVEVLGEIGRVLKPRGTVWWNIGDSYLTRTILHGNSLDRIMRYGGPACVLGRDSEQTEVCWARVSEGQGSNAGSLPDGDRRSAAWPVAAIDHRLVKTAADWDRNPARVWEDIRTHMPEPVTDRPVTGHE